MKNNASLLYNFFLVVGDVLALVAAFVGGYVLRVSLSDKVIQHQVSSRSYVLAFLVLIPFWILIFALLGLYNNNIYERRFREAGRLLIGSFIGLLFIVFWNFLSPEPIFPAKLVPIYAFLLAFVFLLVFRNIARLIRTGLFSYNVGLTKVVIVGNTPMTHELLESLHNSRESGYKVLGVVGSKRDVPQTVPTYSSFGQFLQSVPSDLHGIIQTELYANESRNAEILTYAQEHHVNYRFVPGNSELFVGDIDVDLFRNSVPVIIVRQTPLFGWGRIVKRLTDIVFGGVLLVVSSPLWILCALLVKVTDPRGPILYKAKRLSRFGNAIYVYKFRSMKQAYNNMSPEKGFEMLGRPELAKAYRENGDQLANDPRISKVGKFLRATSLDELPQLFNVLRGDISLVGPRALDVHEIEQYSKKNLILAVKSGLTGLAVVSGRPGISFEERRKLDLYYVQNWSFWLDLTIMAKTFRVILERLFHKGARY